MLYFIHRRPRPKNRTEQKEILKYLNLQDFLSATGEWHAGGHCYWQDVLGHLKAKDRLSECGSPLTQTHNI